MIGIDDPGDDPDKRWVMTAPVSVVLRGDALTVAHGEGFLPTLAAVGVAELTKANPYLRDELVSALRRVGPDAEGARRLSLRDVWLLVEYVAAHGRAIGSGAAR